jgi:DNA-binding MarR family transcriptional regulator
MRCEDCGALIKQIHDAVNKRVNNMLRENGLTFTQIRVLMELGEHGGEAVSLKELERFFRVAQPTVVGIVRRLEAKGLVESFTSPDDNRVKLVKLAESGIQFREMNARAIDEMENRLTSALTESERLEFLRMLRTVRESIK